ncbi:MAG: hypothetical protein ACYC3I_10450 [Gemmataceae bacterium]
MSQPIPPTPPTNEAGWDSLTADIVVADDRGGSAVLPADPEAFARFLAERRQLGCHPAPKTRASES